MRLSALLSLAKDCLIFAIIFVVIFGAAFLIGYRLIYKKLLKGTKTLTIPLFLLYAVFACYVLVVLGATLLRRFGYQTKLFRFTPFYSYLEAWYQFKDADWRNIILNIFMLVPFGFLLPYLFKIFQKFIPTVLAGLGFTLLIEFTQLILRRGIFETDDLINNTVGTIIGYGFYRLADYIYSQIKKDKKKLAPVLAYQIPCALTIIAFVSIFVIHDVKELGNLQCHHITRANPLSVTCNAEFDAGSDSAYVYIVPVANVEETEYFARTFFGSQGFGLDDSRTDIYDETAIYYSLDDSSNPGSLWIDYEGFKIGYTNFEVSYFDENATPAKDNATEEELRTAISELGFYIPETAEFSNQGEGNYRFTSECIVENDVVYDGITSCNYNQNGIITRLDYDTIKCTPYKEFPIISEEEAYTAIKEGRFRFEPSHEPENIIVNDIFLSYEIDSKGFYQPIYIFECTIDGFDTRLYTPAIR